METTTSRAAIRDQIRGLVLQNMHLSVMEIAELPDVRALLEQYCPVHEAANKWYVECLRDIIQGETRDNGKRVFVSLPGKVPEVVFEGSETCSRRGTAASEPSFFPAEYIKVQAGKNDRAEKRVYTDSQQVLCDPEKKAQALIDLQKRLLSHVYRSPLLSATQAHDLSGRIADFFTELERAERARSTSA